jgi:hypothetical protein
VHVRGFPPDVGKGVEDVADLPRETDRELVDRGTSCVMLNERAAPLATPVGDE